MPGKLQHIKFGDKQEFDKQDVEDWIIYAGDSVLFGNFINQTLR